MPTSFHVTKSPAPHLPAADLEAILNKSVGESSIADLESIFDALGRIAGAKENPAVPIGSLL